MMLPHSNNTAPNYVSQRMNKHFCRFVIFCSIILSYVTEGLNTEVGTFFCPTVVFNDKINYKSFTGLRVGMVVSRVRGTPTIMLSRTFVYCIKIPRTAIRGLSPTKRHNEVKTFLCQKLLLLYRVYIMGFSQNAVQMNVDLLLGLF